MSVRQSAVHLRRSEVLAFGAALFHETGGISLGIYSPTRILNHRTGLHWSAEQWWSVIQPHYEAIVNPCSETP